MKRFHELCWLSIADFTIGGLDREDIDDFLIFCIEFRLCLEYRVRWLCLVVDRMKVHFLEEIF